MVQLGKVEKLVELGKVEMVCKVELGKVEMVELGKVEKLVQLGKVEMVCLLLVSEMKPVSKVALPSSPPKVEFATGCVGLKAPGSQVGVPGVQVVMVRSLSR